MFKTAIKGVAAHKLRLALTTLAIVLGVAFVSGAFVFTDSINARFDSLFTDVYAGIDVTVRPADDDSGELSLDAAVLETVASVDGVAQAAGSVAGYAQIIDAEGEPIGGQGPPTLGFSWVDVPALNTLTVKDGRAPEAPGEVVIDAGTATTHGFAPGDTVTVETQDGAAEYELVGVVGFGSVDNISGATIAAFSVSEAQRLFDMEGRYSSVDVVASADVDADVLAERIASAAGAGVEVVTGDQQSREDLDEVSENLGFLTTALLTFAGVAVFVGAFIIQNTFRIIVGQRTRELALLRAVGASSRQVTLMMVTEAVIVAVVASLLGVVVGIGVAEGVGAVLNALGAGFPDGDLTIQLRTVAVGLAVGVGVTLLSALVPARKAAQVPPVAAMREEVVGARGRKPLRRRAAVGTLLTVAGGVALAAALFGNVERALELVGIGAGAVFLGVSTLAPLLAVPTARLISAPFRGIVSKLARENTIRVPRRTAATASALMVGVALVAFVSVFAASVNDSVEATLEESFAADLRLSSSNPVKGVNVAAIDRIEDLAETETVSAVYSGDIDVDEEPAILVGVDPTTVGEVYSFGPSVSLDRLADGGLVYTGTMDDRGWAVGDTVDLAYPNGTVETTIVGTFDDETFGNLIVSTGSFRAGFGAEWEPGAVLVSYVADVGTEEARTAVERALESYPSITVQDSAELIAEAKSQVDMLLSLFTGLLGLALVIAVLGIANTLALSITERTREIGLLRAVGMGRKGIRRMIRLEGVIIATFGAILGVAVGTGLGAAVIAALSDDGMGSLTVPVSQLGAWVVAGGIAGMVAAMLPARRAARLDVLDAISYQ